MLTTCIGSETRKGCLKDVVNLVRESRRLSRLDTRERPRQFDSHAVKQVSGKITGTNLIRVVELVPVIIVLAMQGATPAQEANNGRVAQLEERWFVRPEVAGSGPVTFAIISVSSLYPVAKTPH